MGTWLSGALDAAVDAAADLCTHAGLFAVTAISGATGEADNDTFTKASHGLADGDPVILTAMTGGTGLVAGSASNADGAGRVYFVRDSATDTFKLAALPGGTAVVFSTDVSAVTVNKLVEVTGGTPAYARQALSKAAASGGVVALDTQPEFDVPACTVGAVGYFSAATAGTLYSIDGTPFETFGAQGTTTLTSGSLTLANQ